MASSSSSPEKLTLGVGELVAGLKALLEDQVGRVFVVGEISNLHSARSGHHYFTLKDESGQMRAALFRGPASRLRFRLEEGLEVVAESEVSVYPARGDLQLIVRSLEPRGVGALQLAFEQMRKRLQAAGLFDEDRKRPLPDFPRRLAVVTSPTSAAVRDVLKVAGRRFPAAPILISPTLVQGETAPAQIVRALERAASAKDVDLILLVRGGGSLEDLWAFNTEAVAHAIAASPVPVISGVGHETDLTIADLVADARAPTPSAAAMQALPDRQGLVRLVARDASRLRSATERRIDSAASRLGRLRAVLAERNPAARIARVRTRAAQAEGLARAAIEGHLDRRRRRLAESAARLEALSPLAVLSRGYALVRQGEEQRIVRAASELEVGDEVDLKFGRGRARAHIDFVEAD